MAKRTLDDVFNDDPLGLLEVSVTKSKGSVITRFTMKHLKSSRALLKQW